MTPRPQSSGPSCLLIVAAAGYGKTHELEAASVGLDARLVSAVDLVAARRGVSLAGDGLRHVLVDDLDGVGAEEQLSIARMLARLPGSVSITVASGTPVSDPVRDALGRATVQYGPPDLALDFADVAAALRDDHDVADPDLASRTHRFTAGWPELVHRAGDVLDHDPEADIVGALTAPGTELVAWLHDRVLAPLPPDAVSLLGLLADLEAVIPGLLETLVPDGSARPDVELLREVGVLVPWRGGVVGDDTWSRVVPAVAEIVRATMPRARQGARRRVLDRAAGWYLRNGLVLPAAAALERAGADEQCRRLVVQRGDDMLAAGGAALVRRWCAGADDERSRLLAGDAARMTGDPVAAQRSLAPVIASYEGRELPTGVAWRAASVAYLTACYTDAATMCDRAPDTERPGAMDLDGVRTLACRSSALFMLGDTTGSLRDATAALDLAESVDCDRALAFAHLAQALVANGARRENHLAAALSAAERSGDVVSAARALLNQADSLLRVGDFRRALAVGQRALEAAELGSPPGIVVYALCNVGEALLWLGRLGEAQLYYGRVVQLCRRLGLARTATGLWGLAEVERHAGRFDQAEVAYAEVIDLVKDTGELQILVPALAGLARVLVTAPPTADLQAVGEAGRLADEALAVAPPELRPTALVAGGWVSWRRGDHGEAQARAHEALRAGRRLRSAVDCAAALDLMTVASTDISLARRASVDAERIWRDAGAEIAAARSVVVRAALPDASQLDRAGGADAGRWLTAQGVTGWQPTGTRDRRGPATSPVEIKVLGAFEVLVDGESVPLAAWKSRQARSLVKILAARRGRVITRPALCELLWPDDDPSKTPHRLSVLLSAVRSVLDPARLQPQDYYVVGDLVGVRLDIAHVEVDAERFLRETAEAVEVARAADVDAACSMLARLEPVYRGEAFEDDPYDDWADGLREETRAAWLGLLRLAASLNSERGDVDRAVSCLVRLLGADPFDEDAYQTLVCLLSGAGRHGEARRAQARWHAAMVSIDVPIAVLPRRPRTHSASAPVRAVRSSPARQSHRKPSY